MNKPCEPIPCPEPEEHEIRFIAPHYDYYQTCTCGTSIFHEAAAHDSTCPIRVLFKDQG